MIYLKQRTQIFIYFKMLTAVGGMFAVYNLLYLLHKKSSILFLLDNSLNEIPALWLGIITYTFLAVLVILITRVARLTIQLYNQTFVDSFGWKLLFLMANTCGGVSLFFWLKQTFSKTSELFTLILGKVGPMTLVDGDELQKKKDFVLHKYHEKLLDLFEHDPNQKWVPTPNELVHTPTKTLVERATNQAEYLYSLHQKQVSSPSVKSNWDYVFDFYQNHTTLVWATMFAVSVGGLLWWYFQGGGEGSSPSGDESSFIPKKKIYLPVNKEWLDQQWKAIARKPDPSAYKWSTPKPEPTPAVSKPTPKPEPTPVEPKPSTGTSFKHKIRITDEDVQKVQQKQTPKLPPDARSKKDQWSAFIKELCTPPPTEEETPLVQKDVGSWSKFIKEFENQK